jgi:hypothetical protein
MSSISRRLLLAASTAALLPGAASAPPAGSAPPRQRGGNEAGLHSRAVRKGLFYGTALESGALRGEPALMEHVPVECGMLVSEANFKWADLRPAPDKFSFERADMLTAYAARHNMRVRGHTLVWHEANPDWLEQTLTPQTGEKLLTEHIHAPGQRAGLPCLGHAAEHQGDAQAHVAAVGAKAFGDLAGQLAGWREHQGAAASALQRPAIGGESLQDRQGERGGLAGAGLGDAQYVTSGEHVRDGLGLDRGRRGVAFAGQRLQQGRAQPKVLESCHQMSFAFGHAAAWSGHVNAVGRTAYRRRMLRKTGYRQRYGPRIIGSRAGSARNHIKGAHAGNRCAPQQSQARQGQAWAACARRGVD